MKKIILIAIGFSSLIFADFTRDSNKEIVTDKKTGLMWQDNADVKSNRKTWTNAIGYCENLTLGGYSDWRLPNVNELKSIIDISHDYRSFPNTFVNIVSSGYWTSTTFAGGDGYSNAWYIDFLTVTIHSNDKDTYADSSHIRYVCCVRAGD